MEMGRKITTATSTFYCYFCSRHILITFVGLTLLIVNYGVNTVQMSAVPHRNENCNSSICSSGSGNNVVSSKSGNNLDNNKKDISRKIVWKRSVQNITNIKSNTTTNFLNIALPAMPTAYKDDKNIPTDDSNDNYADNNYKNMHNPRHDPNNNSINHTETDLVAGEFAKFRKSRLFGLFGSNFSLSYNLSLTTGTSAGNITVVAPAPAPAPAYYYAPAPYSSYGYYDPYGYYNPYAYNPYAYNPYAGYGYYG